MMFVVWKVRLAPWRVMTVFEGSEYRGLFSLRSGEFTSTEAVIAHMQALLQGWRGDRSKQLYFCVCIRLFVECMRETGLFFLEGFSY